MSERALATIAKIEEVRPIEGADRIEHYRVRGWWVVGQKGQNKVGDLVVFCEVDSWIPYELAPFLHKDDSKSLKEYLGVPGTRLRTIKMRGAISQGLILNIIQFDNPSVPEYILGKDRQIYDVSLGDDVTDILGILKWEPPADTSVHTRGAFPIFIPKTDQERVQNLWGTMPFVEQLLTDDWQVTEKLDGQSLTIYRKDDHVGVCTRNQEVEPTPGDRFSFILDSYNIRSVLEKVKYPNIAIQGELIGPGVQGNKYQLSHHEFHVYDIWDIDNQVYLSPGPVEEYCSIVGLTHVPVHDHNYVVWDTMDRLLQYAKRESNLNPKMQQEGFVFKSNQQPGVSFKVINNNFLLKFE